MDQAEQAVQQAPDMARRQTRGNPLAAGLVAFGLGLLTSSLLPATRTEQEKAAELMDRGGEALEPVKKAAAESAQHLREGATEISQSAAAEVRDSAAEAARTTQEAARDQGGQVAGQARDSGRNIADEARRSGPG
ncbi:hypothetical protein [Streptomyces sp. MJP52]|nr:hypothetical protein [Streptomyces sp. MJP52]MDH6227263.1 glutamate synthase domain-containing protein 1 [Streptomyces sp. MJP52]